MVFDKNKNYQGLIRRLSGSFLKILNLMKYMKGKKVVAINAGFM